MEPSPYLPTSRRFVNPLYLRVEAIPEFAYVRHRGRIRKARARLQAPRANAPSGSTATPRGRPNVPRWKACTASKRSAGRETGLRRVREREGRSLDDFATWCALAEKYGDDWHQWPEELQHPASRGGRGLRRRARPRRRLPPLAAVAARRAAHRRAGHRRPGGHGSWASCTISRSAWIPTAPTRGRCRTCLRSASPRAHRPMSSTSSARTGRSRRGGPIDSSSTTYEPFRALVDAVLRHAGGVRIDHIIGLFRLWWIPKGALPTDGTYVRYDHEAMIGIVALEAHRAGAVVVGEDLGTVEPWVRDYLRERGLFGTSILWFEAGPRRRAAARREVAGALPVVGDDARPAADGGLPRGRARAASRKTRPADSAGRRGTGRRPGPPGGLAGRTAPGGAARRTTPSVDGGRPRALPLPGPHTLASCWRCHSPTRSAMCAPRTSRAPPTNTRTGGSR